MTSSENDRTLLRDQAARFASQNVRLGLLGRVEPGAGNWDAALQESGWNGLLTPEAMGGSGLSLADMAGVAEEIGRKLLPSAVGPMVAAYLLASGAAAGKWAQQAAGQVAVALSATMAEQANRTVDVDAAGRATLNGSARIWTCHRDKQCVILDAVASGRPVLVLAPFDLPGIELREIEAVDGSLLAIISFTNADLPDGAVLDQAEATIARARAATRMGLSAELLGCCLELFDRTLAYMRTRRQFGKAISEFQALQHRATDIFVDLELSRALVHEAAQIVDSKEGSHAMASAARARICETAMRVLRWAAQMHGGIGFTDECDIGLFIKRIVTATRCYSDAAGERRIVYAAGGSGDDLATHFQSDSVDDQAFRSEVRKFLTSVLPNEICDLPTRPKVEVADWWHRKLYEKGWIAPAWPKAHGGMEATVEQRIILFEELAIRGAPELSSQAIYHIGPTLIRFGTPEQKTRHLPGMLDGSVRWCQGYSEPGSGSDLASLQTSGEVRGDKIIVNGQKIWTTGGHVAHWMFALIRTDKHASDRRRGISMVLIDLSSDGVRRRPIRTISGEDEFSEVYFDEVEVPIENIVGGLNNGWDMANAVLDNERLISSTPQKIIIFLERVRLVAKSSGAFEDAAFSDRFTKAQIDVLAFTAAFSEALRLLKRDAIPKSIASALKIANGEILQNLADLLLEAAGPDGASLAPIHADCRSIHVGRSFLQARRATIYGGTSEIQKNIVARRVLGL